MTATLPSTGAPDLSPTIAGQKNLSRSWQRCREAGLNPNHARFDGPHLSHPELRLAGERHSLLTTQARPVMEYLYGQIRGSGCIMLLSDERGFLLDTLGDIDFANRAAEVALKPGACWAEHARGTNAIGTALVESKPVVVNGAEHYFNHNNFLACAATPLYDPNGGLLGVIDISCDSRIYHPHTFSLVRTTAQMIETRIFELAFRKHTKLRFHVSSAHGLTEGVLALSEDGRLLGANRTGFDLLSLRPADIGNTDFSALFNMNLRELIELDHRAQGRPVSIQHPTGGEIFLSIEQARFTAPRNPPLQIISKSDALDELDTGDTQVSQAIQRARRVIGRPVPILIQGETGVGKDMFARALHMSSPRRNGPFVAVNCAALPESLIESELFGHAPGAFTGARREGAPGRFREAHGGTLFLDEIGDMPLAMQTRLLRVLEERKVTPLGGKPVAVDFMLIAATHRDLKHSVATHDFRADLYYRLNGLSLALPAARERTDLASLIERILDAETTARGTHSQPILLATALKTAFLQYNWPGNLRQLSVNLRTACLMLDDDEYLLDCQHFAPEFIEDLALHASEPKHSANTHASTNATTLRENSDTVILNAIQQAAGNMSIAARQLGISRNTLYRRLNLINQPTQKPSPPLVKVS
ncbi:MAG: sigma-54-dependent Fis family transcriptional regulator [Acidocella sp.]|nr:sigma-54-dependent Fis family transcriptional regulator [Acidocella sp.]